MTLPIAFRLEGQLCICRKIGGTTAHVSAKEHTNEERDRFRRLRILTIPSAFSMASTNADCDGLLLAEAV